MVNQGAVWPQCLSKSAYGFHAVPVVGVAFFHRDLGNAVKTEQQAFRLAVLSPMCTDAFHQRSDIARVGWEALYKAHLRLIAPAAGVFINFVDYGCRRAGRVLRVKWDDQYAVTAVIAELHHSRCDGWVAVAHTQRRFHCNTPASQFLLHTCCLMP